ncbi:cell wall glycosyl hydrolase [Pseudomassariella vexata]|uniref:Mannan endo-1,6-alpha-mannosidase n=1 Tax=Pseudomassariella vexata TaxID=1141098 RepID=A0A1Y2DKE9_9PEZI|nr:cell wall glycosyl hydrolase [Pseudomassariella vexata]ORY59758.1 cell wall glycosyl hydrolase [Pseudomassariella vexata]
MRFSSWPVIAYTLTGLVTAVDINWNSDTSIKDGAATIAYGLMKYYSGNNTGDVAGNLPDPYYWWEAGAMFGTMVDYWAYTGDDTYVDVTFQALQHQVGDDDDFMPTNQTLTEGNDDQGFWALSAMTAAEMGFKNPENGTNGVQWLALAQAVFNEYVWRWDNSTCGGGLRWQVFTFNNGYNYKNAVSNGCFFNIAARLARYTGNETYADWAETIYDWMTDVGFIDDEYNVYDGASDTDNCSKIDATQWTYNAGLFMHGAATMWNYTNGTSTEWRDRAQGFVTKSANLFFNNSVMYEPPCEPQDTCRTDQLSFKAFLVRWMAGTAQVMSSTYETIYPLLLASGKAAAEQCDGTATTSDGYKGLEGTACGMHWTQGSMWDGSNGVGQQMAALAAVVYTRVQKAPTPYTSVSGGTSTGDSSGGAAKTDNTVKKNRAITTGDRAGAGILTTFILAGLLGGCGWLLID